MALAMNAFAASAQVCIPDCPGFFFFGVNSHVRFIFLFPSMGTAMNDVFFLGSRIVPCKSQSAAALCGVSGDDVPLGERFGGSRKRRAGCAIAMESVSCAVFGGGTPRFHALHQICDEGFFSQGLGLCRPSPPTAECPSLSKPLQKKKKSTSQKKETHKPSTSLSPCLPARSLSLSLTAPDPPPSPLTRATGIWRRSSAQDGRRAIQGDCPPQRRQHDQGRRLPAATAAGWAHCDGLC